VLIIKLEWHWNGNRAMIDYLKLKPDFYCFWLILDTIGDPQAQTKFFGKT
jgi:hypothetical protein